MIHNDLLTPKIGITTIGKISATMIPLIIIEAIKLLTHDEKVPYLDYVKQIKTNKIATKVKLSDLHHNSQSDRLNVVTKEDLQNTNAEPGDHEGLVEIGRDIEGVELSVVLRVSEGRIRCNLRSNDRFNCSSFA